MEYTAFYKHYKDYRKNYAVHVPKSAYPILILFK